MRINRFEEFIYDIQEIQFPVVAVDKKRY